MTRAFTKRPVWAWVCDSCGHGDELAWERSQLSSFDQMRAKGWWIAEKFGDLCPSCRAKAEVSADIVHACPPGDSAVMPCCGRVPFEALGDRITLDPSLVTCTGLAQSSPE